MLLPANPYYSMLSFRCRPEHSSASESLAVNQSGYTDITSEQSCGARQNHALSQVGILPSSQRDTGTAQLLVRQGDHLSI